VALHHTRKMEAEDPLDTISGTLGLVGCADTALVLTRTGQGTTLYIRGRDVEESEHAISFNRESCRWTVLGDAADVRRSSTRNAILEALSEATSLMGPADIASVTELTRNTVDVTLHRMASDGEVLQVSRGRYAKDFATPVRNARSKNVVASL